MLMQGACLEAAAKEGGPTLYEVAFSLTDVLCAIAPAADPASRGGAGQYPRIWGSGFRMLRFGFRV